jgi:glutaconate CoA-transferase subunit B
MIARELYAPNITILSLGYAVNPGGAIPWDLSEYATYKESCECFLRYEDLFDFEENGTIDLFFASGMQIDPFGGINLVCIGDWHEPKVRGPGTIGLAYLPRAKRVYIWTHSHSKRIFVEKLDFHSFRGYRGELPFKGPELVVTNLCVMDFDEKSKRMRLKSTHPGVSIDDVRSNTGFELIIPEEVGTTEPPTKDELDVLRRHDINGILRRI